MLARVILTLLVVTQLSAVRADVPASQRTGPAGIWLGSLSAGGQELRLLVTLNWYSDEGWRGTMVSLDQSRSEIRLERVIVDGTKVRFDLKRNAYFEGELADDQTLKGTWTQSGVLPLTLKRQTTSPLLKRPQDPTPPFPYSVREVSFENAAAKATFSGTLTLPQGAGPHPVAVLISGSGPQNRDAETFGHRPFAVWADYLTRRGIAVLRYDDRGVGKSTGDRSTANSADYADDVLSAVNFLKTQPDIDPKRIGLIGHSEGGSIAPIAAANRPEDVAFLVLLAGPGLRGDKLLLEQNRLLLEALQVPPVVRDYRLALAERLMAAVIELPDNQAFFVRGREIYQDEMSKLPPLVRAAVEPTQEDIQDHLNQLASPWMRYFLSFDPAPVLAEIKCPVLAINGEKDLQVPAKENLPAIDAAIKSGGNDRISTLALPKLNHLFQTTDTGLVSEYSKIDETLAQSALDAVGEWLTKTTGK